MEPELQVKFTGDLAEWSASIAKAKADLSSLSVGLNGTITTQNRFGKSTADSARANTQLMASMSALSSKLRDTASQTAANTSAVKGNTDALKSNSDALKNTKANTDQATTGIGGMLKGYIGLGAAMKAGQMFLESTKEVQKFENQLKVASGTQEQYGKNTQFLESLAAKYNKNVLDLGANFAQLTIATRGTNLEGEKTERLFAAVTATSAALQMSVDDTNGTFRAFIQMVSKGNVQAEELRGQLGERLYGAFNLAAKSMGVTTQELNKMLEQGEVLADDLLPKLTVELEKTFGADAEKNAQNLGSSIDYVKGQLSMLMAETAKSSGLTDFFTKSILEAGGLLAQLRLLNKEKGLLAAAGGLVGAGLEEVFNSKSDYRHINKDGFKYPGLEYARAQQNNHGYTPLVGSSMKIPGEMQPSSASQFPFAANFLANSPGGNTSAADEKAKKAAATAARKAEVIMNKWVADQIKQSNDRLKYALIDSRIEIDGKYRKNNGVLDPVGELRPTGMESGYDNALNKTQKFKNDTKGDGITAKAFKNLGSKVSGEGLMSQSQLDMADNTEGALKELEGGLKKRYGSLEQASKEGMGKFVAATQQGSLSYQEAVEKLIEFDGLQNLAANITSAVQGAAQDLVVSFAEMTGSALTGGEGFAEAGQRFGLILAKMLQDLGKALIAFATLKIAASKVFAKPEVALAVGAAAVIAGAVLKNTMSKQAEQGLYTGGIVRGPAGVDTVNTRLSPGEMVLTKNQQTRMFGVLDGAYSGKSFNGAGYDSTSSKSGTVNGQLSTVISGSDLAVVVKLGDQKNAKFR